VYIYLSAEPPHATDIGRVMRKGAQHLDAYSGTCIDHFWVGLLGGPLSVGASLVIAKRFSAPDLLDAHLIAAEEVPV
jgi:hypothetical protein